MARAALIFLFAAALTVALNHWWPRGKPHIGGCGPRALRAAAARLGSSWSEDQICGLFPEKGFEVSLDQLRAASLRIGLGARIRSMTVSELRSERPLGILHVDETHFVAAVGYRGDQVLVVDSLHEGEDAPVGWLLDDLRTRWDGDILILSGPVRSIANEQTPSSRN